MWSLSKVEDFLKSTVSEMMKKYKEDDYEFKIKGSTNIGDGYMGQILFFQVFAKDSGKTYDLLLKLASSDAVVRSRTMMDKNFEREIFVYSVVMPELKNFCFNKNQVLLEFLPEYFGHNGELNREALVLEDLRVSGYAMWKKNETLDYEHTLMVVRKLANWHGVVMAYRDQNSANFNNWISKLRDIRYQLVDQLGLIDHARLYYEKVLKLLEAKGTHDLVEKYRKFDNIIHTFFQPAADENDRLVITHADCWINNLMFRHVGNDPTASSMKIFDFQVCHLNTPIEDISFFIFGSCDAKVLDKFDSLLEEYYSELSSTVRILGSDPEKLFPYRQYEYHWKKYGICGVLSSLEIQKLRLLTEDEVKKADEIGSLDIEMKNKDLYFERLLSVFTHFGNKYL